MSHLLIQMAQKINRRTVGQEAGDPSQSSGQGSTFEGRKKMKMDEKWIPSMLIASWKNWTSRQGIIRIQELAEAVFRLAMPDP